MTAQTSALQEIRALLPRFDFERIFNLLGWARPEDRSWWTLNYADPTGAQTWRYCRIAELKGVAIFKIAPQNGRGEIPKRAERRKIHQQLAQQARHHVLIFLDSASAQASQCLISVVDETAKKPIFYEHLFGSQQPVQLMLDKLIGLYVDIRELGEDGDIPLPAVLEKLSALHVQEVNKRFYRDFSAEREELVKYIRGVDSLLDRKWYASVLLSRLMFIYFLQKKGFLIGNLNYLEDNLKESKTGGADRFYRAFLRPLFFEGFAKPLNDRSPEARALLGDIPYLNGGLFLQHALEERYPALDVPDQAFERLFRFFGKYTWYLNNREGTKDNEIDPDVLGYIFERYINEKALGAYYTPPEITDYLCRQSIEPALLERLKSHLPEANCPFDDLGDALLSQDARILRILWREVLPTFAALDPACGSGAFLNAALKSLLNIYGALVGKIEVSGDGALREELKRARGDHPSLEYFLCKRIITENLYGVDLMAEAVEIARLRLFLALISAVTAPDQLEPLPNIDFNVMQGNSLIGLLRIQPEGDMIADLNVREFNRLVDEKERLIVTYRVNSSLTHDLKQLRDQIDAHRRAAQARLNRLLLDEFQRLKISYPLDPENKKKKRKKGVRPLELADIEALQPFHWGYEFSPIFARGGFDVVLTNPPWESLKSFAKEFFSRYDDSISKNKMTIKAFEAVQARLLQDPAIAEAWRAQQSNYALQSEYFRAAYVHQVAVVNGERIRSDLNLYRLFAERAYHLLRPEGGHCGIVLPSGIYSDLGALGLRELLFERTRLRGLFAFENRKGIFQDVVRQMKFALLAYGRGGRTERFPAAFMRHDVKELEGFPKRGAIPVAVDLIRRLSPTSLSIPELKSALDVQVADKALRFPLLGADVPAAWRLRLGQEFSPGIDSHLFRTEPAPGRLPLYEGKMIHQFTHRWQDAALKYWIDEGEGRRVLLGKQPDVGQLLDYQTYRLAYRHVASSTNERTLIATVLPPRVFASDSLYLSRGFADAPTLLALAALLNSFVLDFLIRMKVNANVSAFYVYQLPVPRLAAGEPYYAELVARAGRLICTEAAFDDLARQASERIGQPIVGAHDPSERARLRAEIDGLVAHLYGLSAEEFDHVLASFPLVAESVKAAAREAFRAIGG